MNKRQRKKAHDQAYRSAFTGTTRVRRRAAQHAQVVLVQRGHGGGLVQRVRGQVYLRWGSSGWWRTRRHNKFERYSPGTLRRVLHDLYRAIGRPVPEHVRTMALGTSR